MALLTVNNLSKKFGKKIAVSNISFDIEEGRCITLLGPNGAGKTTTIKMLTGLSKPSSGNIQFNGLNNGEARHHIGYLPQYPNFYNWMTGREFLKYVGKLAYVPESELEKRCDEIIQLVGLEEAQKRRIGGYSGGMKQRLGLAQALINNPKLIILDEPVSSLDPLGRREVLKMMKEIKERTTILFSTHVLHDAEEISDDILIMKAGEIVLSGDINAMRCEAQQPLIKVQADQSLEKWTETLKEKQFIKKVSVENNRAELLVNDLNDSKQIILQDLLEKNISIRKFEIKEATLEDLFMKVVEG